MNSIKNKMLTFTDDEKNEEFKPGEAPVTNNEEYHLDINVIRRYLGGDVFYARQLYDNQYSIHEN